MSTLNESQLQELTELLQLNLKSIEKIQNEIDNLKSIQKIQNEVSSSKLTLDSLFNTLPKEFRWIAKNKSGDVYAYNYEPVYSGSELVPYWRPVYLNYRQRQQYLYSTARDETDDWKNSLIFRG